jgi:hypothetical protein
VVPLAADVLNRRSGRLIVPGGVEGEFAEEFACGGVDDADVQVVDWEQDAGSGVGAADADVFLDL